MLLEEISETNLSCISEQEDNEDYKLSSWYDVITRFERYSKRKITTTAL